MPFLLIDHCLFLMRGAVFPSIECLLTTNGLSDGGSGSNNVLSYPELRLHKLREHKRFLGGRLNRVGFLFLNIIAFSV